MKTPKKLTQEISHLLLLMVQAERKYRIAYHLTEKRQTLLKEYCDEQAEKRHHYNIEIASFFDNKMTRTARLQKMITVPAQQFIMYLRGMLLYFDPDYLLEGCLKADEKCYSEYERINTLQNMPPNMKHLLSYQMEDLRNTLTWVIQLRRAL